MNDDPSTLWVTFPVVGDDEELRAMQIVTHAVEGLDDERARARVLRWALDRYSPDSGVSS